MYLKETLSAQYCQLLPGGACALEVTEIISNNYYNLQWVMSQNHHVNHHLIMIWQHVILCVCGRGADNKFGTLHDES
jgi:hypothetical protein